MNLAHIPKTGKNLKVLEKNNSKLLSKIIFQKVSEINLYRSFLIQSFFYARSSAWGTIFVYLTLLTMGNYIQNWNWGRTKSLILSHFVLGCSCIILAYIPKKNEKAVLGVYMIGSIFASVSKYIKYFISFLNHIIYGPKSFIQILIDGRYLHQDIH